MISILGFSGQALLLLFVCMAIVGAVIVAVCLVVWVFERIRARFTTTPAPAAAPEPTPAPAAAPEPAPEPAAAPLPTRRIPIDPDTRDARVARLDGVQAEISRTGGTNGWYAWARLFPYEAELSEFLELAFELDENVPTTGLEGGNADA